MKVLVLTNKDHISFVSGVLLKFDADFQINYWKTENYPVDYDIGISFMYQHKVPAKEVNTHAWINFHPGPLPEYKGRNLCYHAVMNGEISWGASVHYMDENFDTGDVIEVRTEFLYGNETAQDLSNLSIKISKTLFLEHLPVILNGIELSRTPQGDYRVSGNYYKKEPISDFIDMNYQTVETFERSVRAITYGDFYPKINIGGVTYKIVRDE